MMYVELMKNFLLADSSELMVVKLISAAWGQKRLIPTFLTWYTSNVWKIFFSPIRASWWLLDSFRPPEPKNVWFLLFRHDVRRVDEKHSSRPFERTFGCWTHFGHLSPNVWFLLFWHDVRRVDEKHSSRPFERTFGCWTHFGHLSPNVWFLLFWHDVRRVDEKFSSRRFERTFGC